MKSALLPTSTGAANIRLAWSGAGLSVVLLSALGCQSHAWPDAWRPISIPKGVAWHNKAYQQTAFDVDENGRVDRLRFWIGSGLAEELIDDNLDGWFESRLSIVYGKERERTPIHLEAPAVPVTNGAGGFDRGWLNRRKDEQTQPNPSPVVETKHAQR